MTAGGATLFATVFALVFAAELPDKTALTALVLATRHPPRAVWLGAALALTIQAAIAAGAGKLLSYLPAQPVRICAGVVFVIAGLLLWFRKEEEAEDLHDEADKRFWKSARLTFGAVFIAELGDLTQISTAALAARYGRPFIVFAGAAAAESAVAGLAAFVGSRAGKLVSPRIAKRVAAVLFVIIGCALVYGVA
jgi:putative Ca2+/H+ antiporter (TMEM165/GDT1 family)